jgi:hypothetical protein
MMMSAASGEQVKEGLKLQETARKTYNGKHVHQYKYDPAMRTEDSNSIVFFGFGFVQRSHPTPPSPSCVRVGNLCIVWDIGLECGSGSHGSNPVHDFPAKP